MSLNKFMHPKNKYKNNKPDFKTLASEYPEFEKHTTTDSTGKVHLDFKDPKALRALTKTLLKHDFQLDVDLPPDRLVPTIPLRLNYIHWIEDILGKTEGTVKGIDIGTGSSCVYPLLGCQLNKWSFLATEMDPQNAHYAAKNVENNHLQDKIKVKKMSKGDILLAAVKDSKECFHFCMCNPPFFADHMEAQAITTSRSLDRADPFSVSTASPEESISQGGEVNFVSQMIDESVELKEQIRVFTSMVGKKSSLPQLKEKLRLTQGATFATTEFCQGKTMRWGIAWTYHDSISFPKSLFHTAKKDKPPLSYTIPFGAATCLYEIADLTQYITSLLCELQIKYKEGKSDALYSSWFITAKEKSWQNQRRKRRKIQKATNPQQKTETFKQDSEMTKNDDKIKQSINGIEEDSCKVMEGQPMADGDSEGQPMADGDGEGQPMADGDSEGQPMADGDSEGQPMADGDGEGQVINTTDNSRKKPNNSTETFNTAENMRKRKSETVDSNHQKKRVCLNTEDSESEKCVNDKVTTRNADEMTVDNQVVKSMSTSNCVKESVKRKDCSYVLKCYINLKKVEKTFVLELVWVDGENREVLHQLMQYFKNKLKAPDV